MSKTSNAAFKSPKTTVMGVLAFVMALVHALGLQFDGDAATVPDWTVVASAAAVMVGLILSRDADKTSKDAGAE